MSIYTHLDSVYKEKQIDKLNKYYGCQSGVTEIKKSNNTEQNRLYKTTGGM